MMPRCNALSVALSVVVGVVASKKLEQRAQAPAAQHLRGTLNSSHHQGGKHEPMRERYKPIAMDTERLEECLQMLILGGH